MKQFKFFDFHVPVVQLFFCVKEKLQKKRPLVHQDRAEAILSKV